MNAKWCILSLTALVLGLGPQGQEPQSGKQSGERPPAPPAESATHPLPPVEAPYVEAVPRSDLPDRFGQRDPIEGFWELRQRTVGGIPAEIGPGYMAIGRRHMIVQFQAPGADPDIALLRAGSYAWTRSGEQGLVRTTVLAGHFNDVVGDVHIEPVGTVEMRQFEMLDGLLRVRQESGDWVEFARIE